MALLLLSVACFVLSLAGSALGDPQPSPKSGQTDQKPNKTQVEAHASPNAPSTGHIGAEAPKTMPPAPVGLAPVEQAEPDPDIAPNPVALEVTEPQPKPLTQTRVAELKQTDPGLISRIISATKGLVGRAVSWLGTRYVWGGISKRGVDCSGLTRLLYKSEGIDLPHSARRQFQIGRAVAKFALLPGDLVFFNTRGPLTHVGMYIGNGQFLHAANPRRGVRIDKLDSPYFSKRFAGARRYKKFG